MQRETIGIRLWEWVDHAIEWKPRNLASHVAIDFSRDRNISYQLSTFA